MPRRRETEPAAGEPGGATSPSMTTAGPATGSAAASASTAAVAFALGIVYVVWGSTYLAIGVVVETMPGLLTAGARFLAASVLMALFLVAMPRRGRRSGLDRTSRGWRRLAITRRQLAGASVIGLLLPAGGNGLVTVAEDHGTPTGIAALFVATVPLYVVVYRSLAGDRPSPLTVVGVLIGFGGLTALVLVEGTGGVIPVLPTLVVAVAAAFWSLGSWLQPQLSLPADPYVLTVYEMAAGGLGLLVMGVGSGESWDVADWSTRSLVAWAYLVVFGSLTAFTAYVWVLGNARISLVATYAYVNPVVALALGALILDEALTSAVLAAAAVVVLGVAAVVRAESRSSR